MFSERIMSLPIFRSLNLKKHSQLQRVFLFENGRKQSIRLLDDRCQFGYSDLRKSLRSGAKFFEMDIFQRFKHEFLFQKLVFPLQFEIIIVVLPHFLPACRLVQKATLQPETDYRNVCEYSYRAGSEQVVRIRRN